MGFGDSWNRVKQVTDLKKQSQLAGFLEISSSNISEAKIKDRFPLHWAFKIGQAYKVSTDWLVTGQGLQSVMQDGIEVEESDESRAHKALGYILKKGNTYQRGVVKGYLAELAEEIAQKKNK